MNLNIISTLSKSVKFPIGAGVLVEHCIYHKAIDNDWIYRAHTHTLIDFIFSYTLNTQGHKIYKEENVSKNKKKSSYISRFLKTHYISIKKI